MPEMAGALEQIAHGVTAVLATWLGLVVLTRAGRQRGARLFAFLAALLVVWSVAIIVQRLTDDPSTVARPMRAGEDVAAFLLPAATLHIALVLTVEGRRSRLQQTALVAAYAVCGAMAAAAAIFPEEKWQIRAPHFEVAGIPGEVFGWAWIVFRLAIFTAAVIWVARAFGAAGHDVGRRRQLQATLATIVVGAVGGSLRILPEWASPDPWVGVSLVTLAVVLAAYAVFAQGIFLSPTAAAQAFRYSLVVGLGITLYAGILTGAEYVTQSVLAIQLPIAAALALVVAIALFDPVSTWARTTLSGTSTEQVAHERLLRALGKNILTAERPERAIGPALARLSRAFSLSGAVVRDAHGEIVASYGAPAPGSPLAMRLPLRSAGGELGEVVFGPKRSQLPVGPDEAELLTLAAGYLGASLRLAQQHARQAEALTTLSAEHDEVDERRRALSDALVEAGSQDSTRLRVFALGSLRVERKGSLIAQWGGAKAGARQAEAIFAFLFDRGDRGASKDEIVELVWPDVDLSRADVAFHRTMNGLRSALAVGDRDARSGTITFGNDRYRLNPSLVAWSDLAAFEQHMAAAGGELDPGAALRHLERARSLYRGDYLDDCPFYGDSSHVEERREFLRGRFVDLLLSLGARHEARGDRSAAAACFREARLVAGDELPSADEALVRLGLASG